jgi:hypothetical protein
MVAWDDAAQCASVLSHTNLFSFGKLGRPEVRERLDGLRVGTRQRSIAEGGRNIAAARGAIGSERQGGTEPVLVKTLCSSIARSSPQEGLYLRPITPDRPGAPLPLRRQLAKVQTRDLL